MSTFPHVSPTGHDRTTEDNFELRFPYSVSVFAKMMREDAQIRSVFNAVTLPIRRATFRIAPNGAPENIVQHVADDLRLPILGKEGESTRRVRGRVSWDAHLQRALLALPYGCVFFEQVYKVLDDGNEHLVKLAPRMPGTIRRIHVADDGGLEAIEQANPDVTKQNLVIPVDRLVAYVYEPIDASWTGTSILRPAFKHWRLRDELMRLEYRALERNSMGVPVYEASAMSANPAEELERGLEMAKDIRAGAAAGVSIPNGARFDFKGVSGQVTTPRQAIEYHDAMMAKSMLAHFLNLDGKGGSYALAETQNDLFVQALQSIADWIVSTANQHIIEDLVALAYPDYEGSCPLLMCDPIASKKELAVGELSELVRNKVLFMDYATEQEIRRRYQLPMRDEPQAVKEQ